VLLAAILSVLLAAFAWRAARRRRRLLASVAEVALPVTSAALGNEREIVVYLPPGYDGHGRPYPVLFINDGQEREALRLRETLAQLYVAGRIRPLIAVAIPTNAARLHEYGTAIAGSRGLGTRAAAYRDFVVHELMPFIDARFRTEAEAAFLGASLGGLSAFDIARGCPERFRTVGVMSGSFWWRAAADETASLAGRRIAHALVRHTAPINQRYWFQAGTRDEVCDRDGNGVIDAIQDTTELIDELLAAGTAPNHIRYVEVTGGRHDYDTWARVLPDFLLWAYGRKESLERADCPDFAATKSTRRTICPDSLRHSSSAGPA